MRSFPLLAKQLIAAIHGLRLGDTGAKRVASSMGKSGPATGRFAPYASRRVRSRMPRLPWGPWSLPASTSYTGEARLSDTQVCPAGVAAGGITLVDPHPIRVNNSSASATNCGPPADALAGIIPLSMTASPPDVRPSRPASFPPSRTTEYPPPPATDHPPRSRVPTQLEHWRRSGIPGLGDGTTRRPVRAISGNPPTGHCLARNCASSWYIPGPTNFVGGLRKARIGWNHRSTWSAELPPTIMPAGRFPAPAR